jgi:dipeptidyl-peptidase-4
MFEYGGPGSQMVVNAWMGNYYLWHQYLASQGFVVACVDGRGTGGRGTAFRTITYKRLGELETKDQIEAAKYLGSLSYVDKTRIGIWGWSFGGYLSTLSILLGNDVFKAAIAVAPVTNWRFYDTIYTERYLTTPQDNAKGYDNNSPIQYADRLKGDYLLIHGTSDDNVHFQNALAMQEALIKAGKQFETFVYPNKAHGISGGKTRLHLYNLMLNFWTEKLKP